VKRYDDPWAELTSAEQAAAAIVQKLIERREEAGLTRKEVSRRIKDSVHATINQYESGEIASPGLLKLLQWADVLGFDLVLVPRPGWQPWEDKS